MRIGVVAPGRPITPELAEAVRALAAAEFPELELVFHPQCFAVAGHFAGNDALRAAAFVEVANDPEFDALWWARGGYGAFRIVPSVLPRLEDAAADKLYLGYSDAGALLGALYRRGVGRIVHAPMAADILRDDGAAAVRRTLAYLADRAQASLEPSLGGAPAAAFNLTILAHLVGTPYLPDLSGHVLLVEEVSEALYRIDRALAQVMSAPALGRLAGLRLGRCSDITANDPEFGRDEVAIAEEWCARAGVPWLGRAEIGHDAANRVVPFGVVAG